MIQTHGNKVNPPPLPNNNCYDKNKSKKYKKNPTDPVKFNPG